MASVLPLLPDGVASARFTAEQFLRMGELGAFDDMKVELADGEIVEVSPPGLPHGVMQGRLCMLLATALAGTGLIVSAETGVVLSPRRVRGLDAAVSRPGATGRLLAPRDIVLAVEIADTTLQRDLGVKGPEYAEAGIADYWVVDLPACAVHVLGALGRDGYARRDIVRFGEPLAIPGSDRSITLDE